MACESNKSGIVLTIAALVGISTAAYFIVRRRRASANPETAMDKMLDYCNTKVEQIEHLLSDGKVATAQAS